MQTGCSNFQQKSCWHSVWFCDTQLGRFARSSGKETCPNACLGHVLLASLATSWYEIPPKPCFFCFQTLMFYFRCTKTRKKGSSDFETIYLHSLQRKISGRASNSVMPKSSCAFFLAIRCELCSHISIKFAQFLCLPMSSLDSNKKEIFFGQHWRLLFWKEYKSKISNKRKKCPDKRTIHFMLDVLNVLFTLGIDAKFVWYMSWLSMFFLHSPRVFDRVYRTLSFKLAWKCTPVNTRFQISSALQRSILPYWKQKQWKRDQVITFHQRGNYALVTEWIGLSTQSRPPLLRS